MSTTTSSTTHNTEDGILGAFPSESPSAESIDALMNSEMRQLSHDERNKVYQDIHCIISDDDMMETPEFLAKAHDQLDLEIGQIKERTAYDLAYSIDRKYVTDRAFRTRFLRASLFDAKDAASRLVLHFDIKLDLFGRGNLARTITQKDLNEEDLIFLYSGYQQLLPVRDRAGRGVSFWAPCMTNQLVKPIDPEQILRSKMRCRFYLGMINSEDEEIQKKGVVLIFYNIGNKPQSSHQPGKSAWAQMKMMRGLPVSVPSIHICCDDILTAALAQLGRLAADTFTRLRIRTHYGSNTECMKALSSYGIPTYALPFEVNGNVCRENHVTFFKRQKDLEEKRHDRHVSELVIPGPFDVLVGRTKLCRDHIGTARYRNLVAKYRDFHEQASNFDKTAMAFMIINIVKESSGRFLKDNGDGWVEVDDNTAREKVSQCFRSFRPCKQKR